MKKLVTALWAVCLLTLSSLVPAGGATPTAKIGATCSKLGTTTKVGSLKLICSKSGSKLLWKKVVSQPVPPNPSSTSSATPAPSATPLPSPTPNPTLKFYVPKDPSRFYTVRDREGCAVGFDATGKQVTFPTLWALVDGQWLEVKTVEIGWEKTCDDSRLPNNKYFAYAKAALDDKVKIRWKFVGPINIFERDSQGNGYSQPVVFSAPWITQPFKAKLPITLPVPQNGPITFSNILDKVSLIPKVAWESAQKVSQANSTPNIGIDVYTGPNTKLAFPGGEAQIKELILKTARLFDGFAHVPYVSAVSYTAVDEPWAEEKLKEIAKKRGYVDIEGPLIATKGNCQQSIAPGQFSGEVTRCGGSNAGPPVDSNEGLIEFGMDGSFDDPYFALGALIAHEFTHLVQDANWIGNPNCRTYIDAQGNPHCQLPSMANAGFSPCWLFEGVPQANGRGAVASTLNEYMVLRNGLEFSQGVTKITDYKEASLLDYLYNQSAPTCYRDGALYRLGYTVGFFATEALIAIGGAQSTMALYSMGAEGLNFEDAFQKVYGIGWREASKILAKVIDAEYATFGPPPR